MTAMRRIFNAEDYIEVTMNFGCNLRCIHCMIEGTMNWLSPQSLEAFHSILAVNKAEQRWSGLVLTGAEITLDPRLPDLASAARNHGFKNIRIQTHGGGLSDPAYLQKLVDAGINEYFISMTAADESLHDRITGVPGSFRKTLMGLSNLCRHPGVAIITNTVITSQSYRSLPDVVALASSYPAVVQLEFWNYFPMRSTDDKSLLARFADVSPFLLAALAKARALSLPLEIKNYPHCLLGDFMDCLCNDQPQLEIDPRFWQEFSRNGFYQCRHKSSCQSSECLGINTAYINRFGWEADLLSPLP